MNSKLVVLLFVFSAMSMAQINRIVDEKSKKVILVGACSRAEFSDSLFSWWYNSEYDMYAPDSSLVSSFSHLLSYVKIKVILGTWCGDSRREVPRFLKILDLAKCPEANYELICVDRKKKGTSDETDSLSISLVPTFIVYQNSVEIGRITETPSESLDKDLNKILIQMIKSRD